jgi:hypothetical protein
MKRREVWKMLTVLCAASIKPDIMLKRIIHRHVVTILNTAMYLHVPISGFVGYYNRTLYSPRFIVIR